MIRKAAPLILLTALLAPTGMAGTAVASTAATSAVTTKAAAPAVDPLLVEQISSAALRDPATPITISGVVTGTPSASVRVRVHWGQPFQTRAQMAAFAAGQGYPTPSYNTKVQATPLDGSGKLRFEFTVTPRDLGMSRQGVYPLAIEVQDAVTLQPIEIERTFLTYVPDDQPVPKVKLAMAMPIVDRPHRADDSDFIDDDLRASVSTGRLASLLDLVQKTGRAVTWFVDPALLDDARRTATGEYTVRTPSGGAKKAADPAARRWLDGLRAALTSRSVVATPYADPDVTALVHAGLDSPTEDAVKKGAEVAGDVLGREISTATAWPVGGALDRDGLDELATSGVRTVLLSGATLPPDPQITTTPDAAATVDTVSGPVTALLTDPTLSEILDADASVPGAALLARQRFLAETAMIAFEQPQQAGQGGLAQQTGQPQPPARSVIAAPSTRLWNPDPEFVSGLVKAASAAPWLQMATLNSIRPGKVQVPRSDLVYTDQDREAELPRSYLGGVKKLSRQADIAQTVTVEPQKLFDNAVLRLTSASWRGDAKRAQGFVKHLRASIEHQISQVSVIDTPRALAGNNGQVPVSVDNSLSKSIALKIRVTSDDKSRLAIDANRGVYETEQLNILGNRSQLVNVPVTVHGGGGESTISVQLLTADGRPYGKEVHVTVRATGYTGIALVIVGAALTIMLAAVVMRILRRRSGKSLPSGAPKPPDEAVEQRTIPADHGEKP
ncbi:DUF6049 family protein [Microtetraspora sp. NBRC 16547]|uniref:DUF6049 family protein n=1 Tax=Microtetraspora sp. NBRC 16547 TaxID=3030993 RepID=UPI00249F9EC7|nr:DUF6049 family protein [Microtetraspora sp. NBRC 16547]GLX01038.1 hypothetical protein Misp02_51240 [Microtetraspora sp. NBRC 16547]